MGGDYPHLHAYMHVHILRSSMTAVFSAYELRELGSSGSRGLIFINFHRVWARAKLVKMSTLGKGHQVLRVP
jgi:CRISPR/Cas system CSM-associated protein Csm3 (group 7 of RAMP superfamily)